MKKTLIAIDGLDASGKKTQTNLLTDYLTLRKIEYRHLSFPTYEDRYASLVKLYFSGAFGDDPEVVNVYAASSFFAMDRYSSYMLDWKKDYDEGKIIIANRYTTANAVHQLSKLPDSEYKPFLKWLYDYEFKKLGLPRPDVVLYLSLPPELSLRLIEKRSAETGLEKDIHEKSRAHIQNSYNAVLFSSRELGWHRIDCNRGDGMRSREDIHGEIVSYLNQKGIL
jgi:dTMP kinase